MPKPFRARSSSTSAIDARLGGVPGRTGAGRRTCSSCSTTTPARRLVAVRRADQHADAGPARGERADLHAVAHDGVCSPTRSTFLTGRNHHQTGSLGSPRRDRLPGLRLAHPAARRVDGRRLRDAGWTVLGRQTNVAVEEWTMGCRRRSSAVGPWLRPLLRLHRRRDQQLVSRPGRGQPLHRPAVPARRRLPPVQGPGRQGARFIRDSAVRAGQALVPVVLPGRQPRPAPLARRTTSTSTRAMFDDGYEAYRDWVLPRMIERGILPEGTELTPINPMTDGHVRRDRLGAAVGLVVGRREAAVLPHGRGVRRVLRVHRRPGRPDRRLPRGVGPARQHADPVLRRQRRLGRGQPERLGEREQVLQRAPRTSSRTTGAARPARHGGHLQPLPDGMGRRVLDAVPDVQALLATRAAFATRS